MAHQRHVAFFAGEQEILLPQIRYHAHTGGQLPQKKGRSEMNNRDPSLHQREEGFDIADYILEELQ